ncbi:MAG: hypothetical protein QNJ51_06155 [Calothrix sp. MO_167.B12]|nr:hypothetical protein [Calothrix sp. MO_167.B12]
MSSVYPLSSWKGDVLAQMLWDDRSPSGIGHFHYRSGERRREGGKEGRREGVKEGRREGEKEGRSEGGKE